MISGATLTANQNGLRLQRVGVSGTYLVDSVCFCTYLTIFASPVVTGAVNLWESLGGTARAFLGGTR